MIELIESVAPTLKWGRVRTSKTPEFPLHTEWTDGREMMAYSTPAHESAGFTKAGIVAMLEWLRARGYWIGIDDDSVFIYSQGGVIDQYFVDDLAEGLARAVVAVGHRRPYP